MHAICFSILALSSFSRYTLAQNITVGIIGAGVTGLYSAILLQSLDINYEIIEANNRTGGRIWTHYFDPDAWAKSKPGEPEYYDYFVRTLSSLLPTSFFPSMNVTWNVVERPFV